MSEWLPILGTLLGATIGFAGAYLVERQRFKEERVIEMRDRIYGPMFMETNKLLEAVESFESSYYNAIQNLEKLRNDYLFFKSSKDLKNRFSELTDRLDKYQTFRMAAEIRLNGVVKEEVEKIFNINLGSEGAEYIVLRLLMGETMACALNLKAAVFLRLSPQDFIMKEKEKLGEGLQIEVFISGVKKTLKEFELLYTSILAKMEQEPLYLAEREQRKRLPKELENLIEQVKPFVEPK